jgi:hypothetical protein
MRRLTLFTLAVCSAIAIGVAPAVAVDTQGPPCADITLDINNAIYTANAGQRTLAGLSLTTAKPACAQVQYIVTINGRDYRVTPGPSFISIAVNGNPDTITVSARSQVGPSHVADYAPDPGIAAPTFTFDCGCPSGGGSRVG